MLTRINALNRQAPRVRRGVVMSVCLATLGGGLCETGVAASATAVHAQCTALLNVSASRGASRTTFTSTSSGPASCTGRLGPWVMGGQVGWSVGAGRFSGTIATATGGGAGCLATAGHVDLFASAPRFAWFNPPMVTLRSSLTLRRVGEQIDAAGSGQLLATRTALAARSLTLSGSAVLRTRNGSACSASHWAGTVKLSLAIDSQA